MHSHNYLWNFKSCPLVRAWLVLVQDLTPAPRLVVISIAAISPACRFGRGQKSMAGRVPECCGAKGTWSSRATVGATWQV